MKVPRSLRLLVLATGCFFLASATAETIQIRADEWLPYNGPSSRRPPGYMIEMAEQIARAAGHTVDYRHLPWEAALEGVRSGRFDCLVGASAEEAAGLALPELPWGLSQSVAYTFDDSEARLTEVDDIKALRLAVIPDYSYGEELDAWIAGPGAGSDRLVPIVSGGRASTAAVSWLIARKVDVVVEDRNVMRHTLREAGLVDRIVPRIPVGDADPIYIACTPADERGARHVRLFDEGLRRLRGNGELAAILQRYGLEDWLGDLPEPAANEE